MLPNARVRAHRAHAAPRLCELRVRVQRHDRVRAQLRIRSAAHLHHRRSSTQGVPCLRLAALGKVASRQLVQRQRALWRAHLVARHPRLRLLQLDRRGGADRHDELRVLVGVAERLPLRALWQDDALQRRARPRPRRQGGLLLQLLVAQRLGAARHRQPDQPDPARRDALPERQLRALSGRVERAPLCRSDLLPQLPHPVRGYAGRARRVPGRHDVLRDVGVRAARRALGRAARLLRMLE